LVANGGSEALDGLDWNDVQLSVTQESGISGQSAALLLGAPPDRGWLPQALVVSAVEAGSASVRLGNLVILVAGQSNASGRGAPINGWPETPNANVRMLGNDYRWKPAQEPLDDDLNQVDTVSEDE